MNTTITQMYRLMAMILAIMLVGLPLVPGVAAACEGGGGGEAPKLSIEASPTSVTIPKPKSEIIIRDASATENATILNVEAEEKENKSQWSFNVSACNGKELVPFGPPCIIPVTYSGELKSKVTFVALDEKKLSSGTATITATPPIQAEPSETELAFGSTKVGTEVKKTLKIKTHEKVAIKTISSTGPVFTIVTDTCSGKTFEAGSECAVEVSFKPTEKVKYGNTLKIPYEIVSTKFVATREIAMTGEGT